jgi:hypothetical protein
VALMPNVPTVAALGLPGYEGILWIGMMAPMLAAIIALSSSWPGAPRLSTSLIPLLT